MIITLSKTLTKVGACILRISSSAWVCPGLGEGIP